VSSSLSCFSSSVATLLSLTLQFRSMLSCFAVTLPLSRSVLFVIVCSLVLCSSSLSRPPTLSPLFLSFSQTRRADYVLRAQVGAVPVPHRLRAQRGQTLLGRCFCSLCASLSFLAFLITSIHDRFLLSAISFRHFSFSLPLRPPPSPHPISPTLSTARFFSASFQTG
jgi:hypothetical protein